MKEKEYPNESEKISLIEELGRMFEIDQDMREKSIANGGVVEDEDTDVDRKNTARMREIISQYGWPTVSLVGKEASFRAWLLVQHADHDPVFQEECLSLMKSLPTGEVDQKNIAYLEDRVRVGKGLPQVYGTQFQEVDGVYGPKPIEDPETLDERRARVGLPTLEEYKKILLKKYFHK